MDAQALCIITISTVGVNISQSHVIIYGILSRLCYYCKWLERERDPQETPGSMYVFTYLLIASTQTPGLGHFHYHQQLPAGLVKDSAG